ncbi:MAG: TonB-dependent receptor [Paludibacter sp.]|nr:TonB-dependent receptor [Paludibacter sp.]
MNKRALLIAFIFCLFMPIAFSQVAPNQNCTVKGLVLDSISKETIPYVTISIAAVEKPEVYLKRIASGVKGEFELAMTKTGDYRISFESVGMAKQTRTITIVPEQKTLSMGKITMASASKNLSEVTVTALKPLVKVELDKITYDMKSDPEAQSSNTLDMLRKVPLVTVDGDDKIQLKGSSNFKIYMNGKASGMTANNPSQVLKSIPASSIKSIEVITEPGAKYDAEGLGGIINIVTDHSLNGLTGTVRGGADSKGGYNGGLYLSTKIGKFGLTTNLNYNSQHYANQLFVSEKENFNSLSSKYILQDANSDSRYKFYYGNIEASYEFDSLNLVSFTMGGYAGGGTSNDHGNTYTLNANRDTLSAFNQYTRGNDGWGGIDMSLDYQRSFKKPDQLLTLSYKLSRTPNNNDNYSDLTGVKNYRNYNQHILFDAKGDEHTFQADYTEPFNKMHVVEMGAKYILRLNNSVNTYLLQNDSTQQWEPTPNIPVNNLNQTQNILGAYSSYTLKLKKLSFKAGLRYERTGSTIILTDTNFHVSFHNWVPSVSISYKFSETTNLRLSYNQRISRPGIWYLNPFVDNSNPFSITQGNPDLIPEVNHSISLNYSYITPKLNINTSLFTSFTNNFIDRVSKSLNDSVVYNTYKNIGSNQNAGLSLYGNWQPNKSIRINLNSNVGYTALNTNDNSGMNNKGINFSVSGGGQFTLPVEIKLSINGGYYSPTIMLQGQRSGFYYYGLTLNRDFLKKKLNISINARNPFNETTKYASVRQTADYRLNNSTTYAVRTFGLSVSYRFGELKNQIKKVERTITNDDVKGGGGQSGGGGQ